MLGAAQEITTLNLKAEKEHDICHEGANGRKAAQHEQRKQSNRKTSMNFLHSSREFCIQYRIYRH